MINIVIFNRIFRLPSQCACACAIIVIIIIIGDKQLAITKVVYAHMHLFVIIIIKIIATLIYIWVHSLHSHLPNDRAFVAAARKKYQERNVCLLPMIERLRYEQTFIIFTLRKNEERKRKHIRTTKVGLEQYQLTHFSDYIAIDGGGGAGLPLHSSFPSVHSGLRLLISTHYEIYRLKYIYINMHMSVRRQRERI